jgi:serine/threonine protein kinase
MPVSAPATPSRAAKTIGRFEIVRLLGKGNQSEVYLAHDTRLDRDVAIKTLHFAADGDKLAKVESLMKEARTVSKLQHPNMVTLYDAGEHEGQPYLVFEYVEGQTLADVLREEGPMPPARAAEIASQVLDAIACAHAQGVVHRDLKPSNIIMDTAGMPRVMDFGIATHASEAGGKDSILMGSPAYMAPEYVSEQKFGPKSDLFAMGLVLHEMLTGKPAIRGKDLADVLRRVVNEAIPAPSSQNGQVDEKLDDIVHKALAKDPDARWADAGTMKNALDLYLAPGAGEESDSGSAKQSTLDFLLRRMRVKSDFPALSEAITTINRIAASDNDSVAKLSNAILKDFGLTNKLLKLVNSVFYAQYGGGTISTVSRAVVILGFNAVRNIAISLVLFENLQNKGHAAQLKEEFVRVLFSGMLAREMAGKAGVKDAEEGFICSMFHSLGRMLSLFYFPEETEEIKKLIQTKDMTEAKAATQVLGLSFAELGIGIARNWGFPEQIVLSMRKLPEGRVRKAHSNADRLRVLSGFSNELAAAIADTKPEYRAQAVADISARFADSLPLNAKHLAEVVTKSLQEVTQFSTAVSANFGQSTFAKRANKWVGKETTALNATAAQGLEADTQSMLAATMLHEPSPVPAESEGHAGSATLTPKEAQATLMAGLQDISNSLVNDNVSVNDILRMILETMYSGMGFNRVLFCIKDGRSHAMHGKFGFGENVADLVKAFRFAMTPAADVFHVALDKNVDILITDIDDPKIASRVPNWYRQNIPARTFVLFPIVIKGKPLGLIYADKPSAGDIVIPEQLLGTLKALRNQAVLAIKQTL